MRIGSLCSGIGGLELGLERAELGETVWQCEYDPHARTILQRHWSVPIYPDVTDTDWTQVEPVDLICAGYPCQPFSHAGRRKGTSDVRHLWPAVRDAIRDLGPRLVVLENVRGHLSLGFPEVLGDLADLGFDAEWCLLRASDVGAPHQRARLFVAARNTERPPADPYPPGRGSRHPVGEPDRVAPYPADVGHERGGDTRRGRDGLAGVGVAAPDSDPDDRSQRDIGALQPGQSASRRVDPRGRVLDWGPYAAAVAQWERLTRPAPAPTDNGRLSPRFVEWMMGFDEGWVDGLTRANALRCLGNAVVPQVAERFGRMIAGETLGAVSGLGDLLPTPEASDGTGGRVSKEMGGTRDSGAKRAVTLATADHHQLLPTPTANQPGGTVEAHLARKNKNGTNRTRVTDLGMVVEQVLR